MEGWKDITIYTDGSCKGPKGEKRAGWGAVLMHGSHMKEMKGKVMPPTNNAAEISAVTKSLQALKAPSNVNLYTDSMYVLNCVSKWREGWIAKGWKKADGEPVKNKELLVELFAEVDKHDIEWHHVRAHKGDTYNERADILAKEGADL